MDYYDGNKWLTFGADPIQNGQMAAICDFHCHIIAISAHIYFMNIQQMVLEYLTLSIHGPCAGYAVYWLPLIINIIRQYFHKCWCRKINKPSKHSRSSSDLTGRTATGKLSNCAAPNTANANDLSVLSRNSSTCIFNIHHRLTFRLQYTCILLILKNADAIIVNSICNNY